MIWAFTAKIDQTVTVRGRLEPSGSVREVDSPSGGVVSKVFVKEGDIVQQGHPLFDVEAKGLASRRKALEPPSVFMNCRLVPLKALSIVVVIQHALSPCQPFQWLTTHFSI